MWMCPTVFIEFHEVGQLLNKIACTVLSVLSSREQHRPVITIIIAFTKSVVILKAACYYIVFIIFCAAPYCVLILHNKYQRIT